MIGRELDGRYEIIERIGGGGMALVYRARDTLLGRSVAVKVLRQQFVHDEDFIRRFRREARAAASLSHPNIVSIYDVGQEGDVHYIVMEFVEGTTLAEKIKEGGPLPIEEAVHIAAQICDALDHAHQNQIIHRDIKPHNILIGKNGRVKVTDFGIARAAASSDITQTGAVLGSVHYFSPEHAKGVSQGAKSDLYSLGIVLYQMLTGRLPFLGESPISVALKHLREKVEEPRKINPLIPQSLENIVLKALRKNPEERYPSARQMMIDLNSCLLPERRNEPKTVFPAEEEEDDERTIVMPAIRAKSFPENPHESDEWEAAAGGTAREASLRRSRRGWIKPTVLVCTVLLFLAGMWYAVSWLKSMLEVPEYEVPTVIGMTLEEAVEELKKVYMTPVLPVEQRPSDEYPAGVVIDQEKIGMKAKKGASIALVVSSGPETFLMPDFVGRAWSEAEPELTDFARESSVRWTVEYVAGSEAAGTVIGQRPAAGERFNPRDTEIVITVSSGPATIPMPNLIGEKLAVAEAMLESAGFAKWKIEREKTYAPKDTVFKQWPFQPDEPVDPKDPELEIILHVSDGLPDDAVETFRSVAVSPVEPGVKTTVRILVTDAFGANREWKTQEITETTHFTIPLVLTPNTSAVVTVHRNNLFYDSFTTTYRDAVNDMNPDRDIDETFSDAGGAAGSGPAVPSGGQEQPDQTVGQEAEPLAPDQPVQTEGQPAD